MKSILKIEMKRAFCNKLFYIVVVISCCLTIADFFSTSSSMQAKKWFDYVEKNEEFSYPEGYMTYTPTALQIWMPNRNKAGKFFFLLLTIMPLLTVIPYGASYVNDVKSGLINQFAGRVKRKYYYCSKLITAFVSGGTIAVIPYVFNLIWCMCCIPWGNPAYASGHYPVNEQTFLGDMYYLYPVLYIIIYLLYTFVVFGLLNCLALSYTYIDYNPFMVLLLPFIFFYVTQVIIAYGTGTPSYSIRFNSNMLYLYNKVVPAVLLQLLFLLIVDLLFLLKSKKDVI